MRVAIMGDNPTLTTGYGRIARELGRRLTLRGVQVDYLGVTYGGQPLPLPPLEYGENTRLFEAGDTRSISRYVKEQKPDVLLHIRDNWVIAKGWSHIFYDLRAAAPGTKIVLYSPVQSRPMPQNVVDAAKQQGDFLLTMTEYGRQAYIERGFPPHRIDVLYHGADTCKVGNHPRTKVDVEEAREVLGLPQDAVVLGYFAMNMDYRKLLPLAIVALRKVMDKLGRRDVYLVLLTELVRHYNLQEWINNMGVGGHVVVPENTTATWGISDQMLHHAYSALDAYIQVSASEGFGMPPVEAAYHGVPVVYTDTPVAREIMGDYALYAHTYNMLPTVWGTMEWIPDPDSVADLVAAIVKGEARPGSLPRQYRWNEIADQLYDVLAGVAKVAYTKTYFKIRAAETDRTEWVDIERKLVASNARKVLDFGCGTGDLVRYLRSHGFEAYGTDPNLPPQVDHEWFLPPQEALNRRYDATISQHVLEHLDDPKHVVEQLLTVAPIHIAVLPGHPNDDRTHKIPYFTRETIDKVFAGLNYTVENDSNPSAPDYIVVFTR